MKNYLVLPTLVLTLATLCSCATVRSPLIGVLFTDVKSGVIATANPAASKTGESCATSILGAVAYGDSSIDTASRLGGITKISHVDERSFSILGIYATHCMVVYGN